MTPRWSRSAVAVFFFINGSATKGAQSATAPAEEAQTART